MYVPKYEYRDGTPRLYATNTGSMPLLVLTPRTSVDALAVAAAAEQTPGWRVARLEGWRDAENVQGTDLVPYGEPLFAEYVADLHGLVLLAAPLDWLTMLPVAYLGRDVRAMALGEARARPGRAFVKPADLKSFPAAVYGPGAQIGPTEVPDDTAVLVSEVVDWEVEYRGFVCERRVTTLSPYLRDGQLSQTPDGAWPAPPEEADEAARFAGRLVADPQVPVPPATVIDVGHIRGHGWAVIESNPAWASGIYGCDPARILPVLARAAVSREAIGPKDLPWARWQLDRAAREPTA
jgi:hypothetical protein